MDDSDERWKMAIAERIEEIYKLVGGKDKDDEDPDPEQEICHQCHHDKEEHTPHGCFHYDGSEDREYCPCDMPFTTTVDRFDSSKNSIANRSSSAHLSN